MWNYIKMTSTAEQNFMDAKRIIEMNTNPSPIIVSFIVIIIIMTIMYMNQYLYIRRFYGKWVDKDTSRVFIIIDTKVDGDYAIFTKTSFSTVKKQFGFLDGAVLYIYDTITKSTYTCYKTI